VSTASPDGSGVDEPRFRDGRHRVLARRGHGRPDDIARRDAAALAGDFVAAEAAFRQVAALVPLNEVFNNLGAAQSRQNEPETLENFAKALEGDSADPDYHFNLGYALWKRGKFDAAADSFRAALARKPSDTEATTMLGRCLNKSVPRPGDPKSDGLERLKLNFEETAYQQLKAELGEKE